MCNYISLFFTHARDGKYSILILTTFIVKLEPETSGLVSVFGVTYVTSYLSLFPVKIGTMVGDHLSIYCPNLALQSFYNSFELGRRSKKIHNNSTLIFVCYCIIFINTTLFNLFIRQGKLKAESIARSCCQILPSKTASHHLKNLNKFHNQFIVILLVSC